MKIKNILKGIRNIIFKFLYKKANVMSDEETLDYILKNKTSIARYGDGELYLMNNQDITFQKADKRLREKLFEVANSVDKNFLVCIPDIFDKSRFNKFVLTENEFNFWRKEKFKREFLWRKFFNKQSLLGDAFISRFYLRKRDKNKIGEYVKKLKLIWQDRNILFVEGKNSRLGYGNNLFDNAKSIKRILCPPTNAFSKYDDILAAVKLTANKDDLLILALGPTATVMSFDLHKLGFQALDLGHIDIEYEWFRMKATKKEPIASKHVNECNEMGDVNEFELDKEYRNQIVSKIE